METKVQMKKLLLFAAIAWPALPYLLGYGAGRRKPIHIYHDMPNKIIYKLENKNRV